MAQTSFPIKEVPMTDQHWGSVTLGMGSGILAASSVGNYGLTNLDNATNTAVLGARSPGGGVPALAQAIVSGFYHRIDADFPVALPAVTATTTYYIGLVYDPTKHGAAGGPVAASVTTAKPTTAGGKVYLPLYEVVRSANQLLTAATLRDLRVYVSPTLTAASTATLPTPASMLTGTLCTTTDTGTVWRVVDGTWVPANAAWVVPPLEPAGWAPDMFSGGIRVQYRADGRRICDMDVYLRRTAPGSFTQGAEFMGHGFLVPPELLGALGAFWHTTGTLNGFPGIVRLNMGSGQVEFRLASGTQTVTTGSAISFRASWTTVM